jgi:murein DD-endopeptidase MepM/ murein hydrolase activator NlpD
LEILALPMRNRKYFLDRNDLQYKQVKLPWTMRVLRLCIWFVLSVGIAVIYGTIFNNFFGSPKENKLSQEIDNLKLQYTLAGKELDNAYGIMNSLKMSDEVRYRSILEMDSIPESLRKPGSGGIERFKELDGYSNTSLMKSTWTRIEELKNMANVQRESFRAIDEKRAEWERMYEYLPMISPVDITIRLGDGLKFREVHPVTGNPQWHYGQDFETPYGTEVFATGAGTVIDAGWNSGGFGNHVRIDHGYGYQTIYGHLSSIKVSKGMYVKRGDLIGLTGSSGTSSGPHLHYQIDQYGQHKNPLYYFNNDLTREEYFDMINLLTSSTKFR